MRQYLDLLQKLLDEGQERPDRTGTGTLASLAIKCGLTCRRAFPS